MQQTEKYKFNLIEGGDEFSTEPLNENAQKVEELFQGRLCFTAGTYMGNGLSGESNPNRLEFDFKPLFVAVYSQQSRYYRDCWVWGAETGNVDGQPVFLQWGDNWVSWWTSHNDYQMNIQGSAYCYFAAGSKE